jgi:hypothetical protein
MIAWVKLDTPFRAVNPELKTTDRNVIVDRRHSNIEGVVRGDHVRLVVLLGEDAANGESGNGRGNRQVSAA